MPAIDSYPQTFDEVDEANREERRKRSEYITATWQYYRGEHRKPLTVKTGQPDDNVILNLSKKLVDTAVAMLFGREVKFELDQTGETEAEQYLNGVWQANRKRLLLNDIALNGYVTGHPVVRLAPQPEGAPRVINLNPDSLSVFWRADDIATVLFYSLRWSDDRRQDIVREDEGWRILDLERERGRDWTVANRQMWEYPWPPILDWKNLPNPNMYYGLSDLEHADLNDAINFVASNILRILRYHAHPKTIGTGARATDLQETAVDSFWTFPNPEAKIFNLEMQSDLGSSLEYLKLMRTAFFSLGAGVDMSHIMSSLREVTNFSIKVLYKDAVDRLKLKRALYGEALVELNRRILELGGFQHNDKELKTWLLQITIAVIW
ncbi:MAG: phage portal protein, partial [Anaerolineae bacterium]